MIKMPCKKKSKLRRLINAIEDFERRETRMPQEVIERDSEKVRKAIIKMKRGEIV